MSVSKKANQYTSVKGGDEKRSDSTESCKIMLNKSCSPGSTGCAVLLEGLSRDRIVRIAKGENG